MTQSIFSDTPRPNAPDKLISAEIPSYLDVRIHSFGQLPNKELIQLIQNIY